MKAILREVAIHDVDMLRAHLAAGGRAAIRGLWRTTTVDCRDVGYLKADGNRRGFWLAMSRRRLRFLPLGRLYMVLDQGG